jgi:ABC-type antimicrobial peptide transport system permease subunit
MHNLKMILRGWFRSPLSSVISLLSLAIGLLCSTILLLFAVKEFRMAKTLGNEPNVYFIEQIDDFQSDLEVFRPVVPKELAPAIADNYPEVIDWTVIGQHCWNWQYEEKPFDEGPFTISVTPTFTKFITIQMEEGCLDSVLAHHNAIAITRTYANQIFPNENPMGKTISGEQRGCYVAADGTEYKENRTFVVEGIIDDKFHSFLNLRAIFSRSEDNVRTILNVDDFSALIKLQEGVNPDEFLEKILDNQELSEEFYFDEAEIRLQKISDAYFKLINDKESLFKTRDKDTLIIGFSIALIVLVISVFNYLNITLIRAPRRLKNLAGQRIMGATKTQVAVQVIAETFLHVLVSFGFALIFIPDAMHLFNSFMGSDLQWQEIFQWHNLPYILLLLSSLIFIPAIFLMIKFSIKMPMEVFKNPTQNKALYLGSFVVLQLIISVVLIAFSINVKRQMEHIVKIVPQAHQIICIKQDGWRLSQGFVDYIKQSATTTEFLSGPIEPNMQVTDGKGNIFLFRETQPNYFNFLKIPILQGRTFDSIPTDIKQVVANQSYIKLKGIEEPIGYEFTINNSSYNMMVENPSANEIYRIVGVCEDFTTQNATLIISPTLYILSGGDYSRFQINIRFQGSLEDKINEIKEIFEKYAAVDDEEEYEEEEYEEYEEDNAKYEEAFMPKIYTMADYYINLNPEVKRLKIMVEFFAFISIFLSAIGLFGLSWYTVERRHKEMALRKVHGASTGKLLLLLCKTFFIWCVIATIIALPMGYYMSQYWLNGFVYRIDNSLWTLLITALIAAAVTFLTVIFQTLRAARAKPARYIKME